MAMHNATSTGTVYENDRGTQVWAKNDTGGNLSAGAIRNLSSGAADGLEITALRTTTGDIQRVCVLAEDINNGDYGKVYVRGAGITATVPSATYTAGRGLRVQVSGVTEASGAADRNTTSEFGFVVTGGTTVTSITIGLYDDDSDVIA